MVEVRGKCGRKAEADPEGIQTEIGLPNKVTGDKKGER